jgi:hypothetical protein
MEGHKQQAASSKQQAASSKQQAASSKQQSCFPNLQPADFSQLQLGLGECVQANIRLRQHPGILIEPFQKLSEILWVAFEGETQIRVQTT